MLVDVCRKWYWPCALAMVWTLGCGGGGVKAPEEKLVSASGTVKLDGKPDGGVRIRFTPFGSDTKSVGGAWAMTDDDGAFNVIHWTNKEGIAPGSYQVTFSKYVKPDGTPLGEKDSPMLVNAKEVIAPRWSNPTPDQMSALTRRVDIPADGKDDIEFSITSAKK